MNRVLPGPNISEIDPVSETGFKTSNLYRIRHLKHLIFNDFKEMSGQSNMIYVCLYFSFYKDNEPFRTTSSNNLNFTAKLNDTGLYSCMIQDAPQHLPNATLRLIVRGELFLNTFIDIY